MRVAQRFVRIAAVLVETGCSSEEGCRILMTASSDVGGVATALQNVRNLALVVDEIVILKVRVRVTRDFTNTSNLSANGGNLERITDVFAESLKFLSHFLLASWSIVHHRL